VGTTRGEAEWASSRLQEAAGDGTLHWATMERHYTHTTWHVKEGSEEEFVRRWGEWAEWSRRQGLVEDALLLRDTEDPQRFVSFGPWEDVAAIAGWRTLPGYQERVDRLRRVVDGFEPRTLEVVARR
jgi:heme-degrading monooxygenase HmoA